MRRKDREIKDKEDIFDVLRKCDVVRLGFNGEGYPYIVPMNFGFETDGEALTLWFHCALEGRKLDLIRRDARVGFEADCSHNLIENEKACGFTMEYESVIGCGDIYICDDNAEKRRGLTAIMRQCAPGREFEFKDSELVPVCILRLDVARVTGKRLVAR